MPCRCIGTCTLKVKHGPQQNTVIVGFQKRNQTEISYQYRLAKPWEISCLGRGDPCALAADGGRATRTAERGRRTGHRIGTSGLPFTFTCTASSDVKSGNMGQNTGPLS